jgi:hypothetical protein
MVQVPFPLSTQLQGPLGLSWVSQPVDVSPSQLPQPGAHVRVQVPVVQLAVALMP